VGLVMRLGDGAKLATVILGANSAGIAPSNEKSGSETFVAHTHHALNTPGKCYCHKGLLNARSVALISIKHMDT